MTFESQYKSVLVCGGRNFSDARLVDDTLSQLIIGEIIQGGANGADRLAKEYAIRNHIQCREFPADWKNDGRAAGPIRNSRMLAEGKPDLVVAFKGGRGTADMVSKAERAGVTVIQPQA